MQTDLGVQEAWAIAVSKIRENIYRSDVKVTFELYGHFKMFTGPNKAIFTKYCLTQQILKLPGIFEIHWVRQNLVNSMGLAGILK